MIKAVIQEKKIEVIQTEKKTKSISICRWHNTAYRKSSRLNQKYKNEKNKFSKIAWHETKYTKSAAFLYTNNKQQK